MTHATKWISAALLVLTACAGPERLHTERTASGELPASLRLPRVNALPVRIGIEHVEIGIAHEHRDGVSEAPRIVTPERSPRAASPAERPRTPDEAEERRRREGRTRFGFDTSDPVERATDRFLEEVAGYDRRHKPRSLDQIGVLNRLRMFAACGSSTWRDEREREWEDQLIERWRSRLLTRPLAVALRQLPVAHELEEGLEIFKSDHVPLSDPYRETHRNEPDFGRLSLRVRAGNPTDPVEVVYLRDGWRIGTSQENLKLGSTLPVADDLSLLLRGKYRYDAAKWELDATLVWQIGRSYRANFLLSNHIDQLGEPTAFSASPTTFENSNGVMCFFEYVF